MKTVHKSLNRAPGVAWLATLLFCHPAVALAQAPIIQPGAPGEAARELSADEAEEAIEAERPEFRHELFRRRVGRPLACERRHDQQR